MAASVSLVLDDLAAIDTEQLTLGLRVGVNQDTGSVDQQPDTSSADKEKVNWDEVRWNEMKPVKDKDDDDEGSPWKAPSLPDASDIFVIEKDSPLAPIEEVSGEPLELHGLRMFVKFPESAASSSLIPKTLVLIVIVPTRQPGRKMSESHDPCIELYEGIYDKTLLLKASYQSGEASFVGKQSFSLSRESLTTELPDLLLESTTD